MVDQPSIGNQVERRARKRQSTADHLASTAFALFERDGFEAVTMEHIARDADVARATLYNHFPVKEALLDHHFRQQFAGKVSQLIALVEERPGIEDRLAYLFEVFAEWAVKNRKYLPHSIGFGLRTACVKSITAKAESGLQELFAKLLLDARAAGEIRRDIEIADLAGFLEHLYFAATLQWLSSDSIAFDKKLRGMLSLFLRGALVNSKRQQGGRS